MDIDKLAKEISMNQLLSEWGKLDQGSKDELISYVKSGNSEDLKSFIRQVVVILSSLNEAQNL